MNGFQNKIPNVDAHFWVHHTHKSYTDSHSRNEQAVLFENGKTPHSSMHESTVAPRSQQQAFSSSDFFSSNNSLKVQENSILPGNKGHYLVEKFLGEGTFGKVVKCRDLLTDKHVAIKIMKRNDEGEEEIKALTELSKINADAYNLVNFVEWFRYKSDICIVFEMLDKNFNDLMKDRQSSPLDLKEVRAIAWQLIVALKGLKKLNLVHCDIKPDNIMLVDHILKPFRLKLIDFGLAEKTKNLKKGTPMQNRMFRAPEVILGLPLDESLDMWTVGYILAFLYSGYYIHPWDCEYNTIRLDTVEQQSIKTKAPVKDYQEQFVDLLKQMLEMDPKKRISPDGALQHPFFNLKKMNPKTTKPQEPAAAEAHQEPEAKEVKSVSQGPAANPQKRSSDTSKKSSVQQQKTEERKAPSNASSNTASGGRARLRAIQTIKNVFLNTIIPPNKSQQGPTLEPELEE
uniref:Protein kinase domain-containing protein n=1 Tax=Oryzias melastigma TaxID=30732 RepID=A0A3B3CCD6_ORYME